MPTPAPADSLEEYQWPTCIACARPMWQTELHRLACRLCEERVDRDLAALAGPRGLYAQLAGALRPGATKDTGARVTGSRTAPLPLRLEPLSLSARGGVVTVLQTWLVDWHEQLGYTYPRWEGGLQEQLDQAVQRLRTQLPWAAERHPAFAEFTAEIAHHTRACRRQVTGEKPERRIAVACPCGATLHVTISTPGARCSTCGEQYGRADVLELPLAERRMAA